MNRPWRDRFSAAAVVVVDAAGSLVAVVVAVALVLAWLVTGFIIGFSTKWFEILFAVTASITFIMTFLIRHTNMRDNRALEVKIDELVEAEGDADNRVLQAENETLVGQERLQERRPGEPDQS